MSQEILINICWALSHLSDRIASLEKESHMHGDSNWNEVNDIMSKIQKEAESTMKRNLMVIAYEVLEQNDYVTDDILQYYVTSDELVLVEFALVKKPVLVDIKNKTAKEIDVDFVSFVAKCNE